MGLYTKINEWFVRQQNSAKKRSTIYQKLGVYVQNNVAIDDALNRLHLRYSKNRTKYDTAEALALRDWYAKKDDGGSFAASLAGWATDDEMRIVHAGEENNRLPEAFDQLAENAELEKRLKKGVISPLLMPLLGLGVITGLITIVNTMIFPIMAGMMPVEEWTGLSLIMLYTHYFAVYALWPLWALAIIMWALMLYSFPRLTGGWRRVLEILPPYRLYRLLATTSFLLTLSSMLKAKVPIDEALGTMSATGGQWYREQVGLILTQMHRDTFTVAALKSPGKFIDHDILEDLLVYEETSAFDVAVGQTSRAWANENIEGLASAASQIKLFSMMALVLLAAFIIAGIAGTVLQLMVYLQS